MFKILFLFLGAILCTSSCTEKKHKSLEEFYPKQDWIPVRSPYKFRDIVQRALKANDFSMLDSLRMKELDIRHAMPDHDDSNHNHQADLQMDTILMRLNKMLENRDNINFQLAVERGRELRLDWIDPSAKTELIRTKEKYFSGYLIRVTYQIKGKPYILEMNADSLDRGFVLGHNLELIGE